ncbi:serine/threonine-protein kinase [Frankia canadensis]|nr:serine/threonine-protein kinase [Frankia canadensis]
MSEPSFPAPLLPGEPLRPFDPRWIGEYEVLRVLGEGGMGTVYYAVTSRGTPVAVKVIRAEYVADPGFRDRFLREIRNAQRVDPFCTAAVIDVSTGDTPFLATEYVDGPDLRRQVTEGETLSGNDTKRFAIGVATALRAIHHAGIVHRDLKPGNVLLALHGPRVIDFGVASALLGRDTGDVRTEPAVPQWLTPAFMAPEQAQLALHGGQVEITYAADIFAWAGVVVYAATGRTPFGDGGFADMASRVRFDPPDLRELPADLEPIVSRALHKDPARRPTARQLLSSLLGDDEPDPVRAGDAEARRGWETTVVVGLPAAAGQPDAPGTHAGTGDAGTDTASPPPRPRRAGLLVATAAGAAVAVLAAVLWLALKPQAGARLGACPTVTLQTGQANTPYYNYGTVLKRHIEARYPGTTVNVAATNGTADNLNRLQDGASSLCVMAVSQLNTTVDARFGVNQFDNEPLDALRTVGPLWLDLVHLMVREDAPVTSAAQLCGRRVSSGLLNSGSRQIGEVLIRNVLSCPVTIEPKGLDSSLDDLRTGRIDAVLWAGGAPTPQITRAIGAGLRLRMLPLADYLAPMARNWDDYYRPLLGTRFVAGGVYETATITSRDYPGVGQVPTVGAPNGLVVNQSADPALVAFTARDLVEHRADFEGALWGDDSDGRHFETANRAITTSSVYCLIPLAPEAARYYAGIGIQPACDRH